MLVRRIHGLAALPAAPVSADDADAGPVRAQDPVVQIRRLSQVWRAAEFVSWVILRIVVLLEFFFPVFLFPVFFFPVFLFPVFFFPVFLFPVGLLKADLLLILQGIL